ncbi:MAG: 3-hexulose-6-phosphate isomerase, partial [Paucimonas sp.]|nr:3-hexulose-6-phosphate isomerase [Paucimonas sp.]
MDALSPRRKARAWLLALCCALPLVFSGPAAAQGTHAACEKLPAVQVPGAQKQISACLEDLSTRSLVLSGHTDAADWRALHSQQSRNPERAVPGMQVDGYFPDTSTSNGYHGWNHDAQFVMRLPDHWNGKLVITGAPGLRRQYAPDFLISDWMLARGYAYASTDKGNSGLWFYRDGAAPGDAMAEWNQRVTELTLAAKQVVQQRYGRAPAFTYMTGISNGGYLTRHALEQYPELYDGGVDWEGPNWQTGAPNMLTNLPAALKYYPRYAFGDASAHQKMLAAGFAPGSEPLWAEHYALYWDLTARVFREELDPDFDGWLEAGIPFCASGFPLCDADYNFAARAKLVKPALSKIALNGHIGKPLITVQGDLDTVLPPKVHAEPYLALIRKAGQSALHRYYLVEGGNHVDQLYDVFPTLLRPILPCYRA